MRSLLLLSFLAVIASALVVVVKASHGDHHHHRHHHHGGKYLILKAVCDNNKNQNHDGNHDDAWWKGAASLTKHERKQCKTCVHDCKHSSIRDCFAQCKKLKNSNPTTTSNVENTSDDASSGHKKHHHPHSSKQVLRNVCSDLMACRQDNCHYNETSNHQNDASRKARLVSPLNNNDGNVQNQNANRDAEEHSVSEQDKEMHRQQRRNRWKQAKQCLQQQCSSEISACRQQPQMAPVCNKFLCKKPCYKQCQQRCGDKCGQHQETNV